MSPRGLRRLLVAGMTLGVLFMLAPFFGALGSVFALGMRSRALAAAGGAEPAPESIANALAPTSAGLILCPIGLLLLIVCIVLWRHTRPSGEIVQPMAR